MLISTTIKLFFFYFKAYLEIIGGVFLILFALFLLLMTGVIFFSKYNFNKFYLLYNLSRNFL